MKPVMFDESNLTLTAPKGMPDVIPLPVWTDGRQTISCWKPSLRDRLRLIFGGRLWLGVCSGRTQPPVKLQTLFPFVDLREKSERPEC